MHFAILSDGRPSLGKGVPLTWIGVDFGIVKAAGVRMPARAFKNSIKRPDPGVGTRRLTDRRGFIAYEAPVRNLGVPQGPPFESSKCRSQDQT
jgi:hypothetical protein